MMLRMKLVARGETPEVSLGVPEAHRDGSILKDGRTFRPDGKRFSQAGPFLPKQQQDPDPNPSPTITKRSGPSGMRLATRPPNSLPGPPPTS